MEAPVSRCLGFLTRESPLATAKKPNATSPKSRIRFPATARGAWRTGVTFLETCRIASRDFMACGPTLRSNCADFSRGHEEIRPSP